MSIISARRGIWLHSKESKVPVPIDILQPAFCAFCMISFCMIPIFSIPNESPRSPRPTNIVSDCANILSILDTAVPVSILGMTEAA